MQLLLQLSGFWMSAKAVGAMRKASCLQQEFLRKKRQELPSGIHRGLERSFSNPAWQEGDPLLLLVATGSEKAKQDGAEESLTSFFVDRVDAQAVRDCMLSVLLQKSKLPEVGRLRKEEERAGRGSAVEQAA